MKRWMGCLLLVVLALALTGCGDAGREAAAPAAETSAPSATPWTRSQGPVDRAVQSALAPFEAEVEAVTPKLNDSMAVTLPMDILRQMAEDAFQAGAAAVDGRYHFTWRQTGEYSYVAANEEARTAAWDMTPEPGVEAPMGDAELADAEVSGGGVYLRVRVYDAADDLSSGTAEISDTLNGEPSGDEHFAFALRDGCLYYADAVKDLAVDLDTLEFQETYAVTVGILRTDGLDVIQYNAADLGSLPDPRTLDWNGLVTSVNAVRRISARGSEVRVSP